MPRLSPPSRRAAAALALLLPLNLLLPASAPAQEAPGVQDQARTVLRQMMETEGPRIWQQADRLADLGRESVPAIKESLGAAPPWARLGMARALLALQETEAARETLIPLTSADQPVEVRVNAVSQLGIAGNAFTEPAAVTKHLEDLLGDEFDPRVRIHGWRALYGLTKEQS